MLNKQKIIILYFKYALGYFQRFEFDLHLDTESANDAQHNPNQVNNYSYIIIGLPTFFSLTFFGFFGGGKRIRNQIELFFKIIVAKKFYTILVIQLYVCY